MITYCSSNPVGGVEPHSKLLGKLNIDLTTTQNIYRDVRLSYRHNCVFYLYSEPTDSAKVSLI